MSESENVFDKIQRDNAQRLGVSEEELDEMSYREIEALMDLDTPKSLVPDSLAHKYPQLASDRYEIVSPKELDARRERVDAALELSDESYGAVVLKQKKDDLYGTVGYVAETGREFVSEAQEFVSDIASSIRSRN